MLQITEDTPPDMLAGAMDLTVHLPSGRSVKMAVERSTPMMDLLVQITTNHHLQLSNYTLQALGMAPSSEHSDKILPYKPNTPIGTLDTQHIRVIPKSRSLPVPKNIPPGHQPFESTFRLKVHLPRNQLYVTRVSRNVLLEDIMKKVCEEKNLDPMKYEFKHPGNLDEVLDPKLTLSDYQITEIYVVLKGTVSLNQAFSTSDIMALRKEEERKQMHTKTGGGVFNLIFRRGKSSMGSGSVSSDTRSISPTHSDDSRSVTPPAVQQQIIAPPKKEPPAERPKPPQRKRRPAPKPPQQNENNRKTSIEKAPSNISETANEVNELQPKKAENGLTICHSRNSSDSSGYHEASVLSENCNTSLPRRPKSAFVTGGDIEKISELSQSTTNLSKMSSHSKSTTSLGITGRKKKAAPLPPPVVHSSNSSINVEQPSPVVVASQPAITQKDTHNTPQESVVAPPNNPIPLPRSKPRAPPRPRPRSEIIISATKIRTEPHLDAEKTLRASDVVEKTDINNATAVNEIIEEELEEAVDDEGKSNAQINDVVLEKLEIIELKSIEDDYVKLTKASIEEIKSDDTSFNKIQENVTEIQVKLTKDNSDTGIDKSKANLEKLNKFIESNEQQQNNTALKKMKSMPNISQIQKITHENIFSSPEFLGEKKPPEIVALIPKSSKERNVLPSKFDSFGKKHFQIGASLVENFDAETASIHSRHSNHSNDSKSDIVFTRNNSVNSALASFNFVDEFSDLDENVFNGSKIKNTHSKPTEEVFNQLFGMHNLEDIQLDKNQSISSLRSLCSLPGFLNNSSGMKKWSNFEDLDDISLMSNDPTNKWVFGDPSDTESILSTNISPTIDSLVSLSSCQSSSLTSDSVKREDKSFGSTDSGIAQEQPIEKLSESETQELVTPPPPPLLEEPATLSENIISSKPVAKDITRPQEPPKEIRVSKHNTEPLSVVVKESLQKSINNPIKSLSNQVTREPIHIPKVHEEVKDPEISEIDWHYQLPSPPKAFRDTSPTTFTDVVNAESHSVIDFKDSVVTSPELFEKLKIIEDSQSEKATTIPSDLTSVHSEEDKPLLNTLTLENLERRKSLVYNRELATSLKMTDIIDTKNVKEETFSSSLTKFESTYNEIRKSSLPRETDETKYQKTNVSTHTLPNFKISTYDHPKQKIKVFEDDTVRSNMDNYIKAKTVVVEKSTSLAVNKSYIGRSMENISMRKNSLDNQSSYSNEEKDYKFYKPRKLSIPYSFGPMSSIFRSESFSTDNAWEPSKPVSRSKSHLTLNPSKYREEKLDSTSEESMSRSNSLFDVSGGLQSLEVMKLIQNKLNTPTSSMENLNQRERVQNNLPKPESRYQLAKSSSVEEPQKPAPPEKIYKYRGPPSVNMGTWSDRPKVPVSVKEDADYKLSNHVSSKLIVNTTNNNITSNNSIEVKNNTSIINTNSFSKPANVRINGYDEKGSNNVSIKVNGTEPISSTQSSGNVVIKIGNMSTRNSKTLDNQRFISHASAVGYRKPFSNINKNQPTPRPHSVAFDSDFDISRVPVVRSVELKKPYKDMGNNNNTSVTQIYQGSNDFRSHTLSKPEPVSELNSKFSSMYRSSETLSNSAYLNHNSDSEKEQRPVIRVNSFKPQAIPVVRGFKTSNDNSTHLNRLSWNPPATYNTLPIKPKEPENYTTNKHVPFSQLNLRRTESNKIAERNGYNEKPQNVVEINNEKNNMYNNLPSSKPNIIKPPPPPLMPKVNFKKPIQKPIDSNLDPRDQLLSAIRNFGGKKGLKAVKA